MGFIWECLHFDLYSRMSSPYIPDGAHLLIFDVTVTWSSPWDNALYCSSLSMVTSQSFHSDFMTPGGMGETCEVISSVLSQGRAVR